MFVVLGLICKNKQVLSALAIKILSIVVYKHFRVSLGKLYNQLSSTIMHLLHAWGSLATPASFKNDLPAGCLLLTREESLDQALSRHHKLWPLFAQRACLTKVFLSNSCSLLATFSAVSFSLPNKCEISVSIMQFQSGGKNPNLFIIWQFT